MAHVERAILAGQIKAELATGATAAEVAARHQISRRTLYRILDDSKQVTPRKTLTVEPELTPEPKKADALAQRDLPAKANYARAVRDIASRFNAGEYEDLDEEEVRKRYGLSRSVARFALADARAAVRASIDPHYLSAVYRESIDTLRRLAAECEDAGEVALAIGATARVGSLITALAKVARATVPVSSSVDQLNTTEKLVAAGWTPPPVEGLPTPDLDDPEAQEKQQNGRENSDCEERQTEVASPSQQQA